MSNTKKIERPHIVWAIFPPLYWILWAGAGLLVGTLAFGQEAITGVVAAYASGGSAAQWGRSSLDQPSIVYAGTSRRGVLGGGRE
jgi:hypothetical protein